MLDIIIPHYTEPWEVGRKFFDMLNLQRGVDFDKVHVILVNDGQEHALPNEYFANRPYKVEQISIPHAGVSAARNEGLRRAEHEWVMFCDFDDMFAHAYALRDIMTQLPAHGFDMLWCDLLVECTEDGHNVDVKYKTEMNAVVPHAKLYRRRFVLDNDMWFNTELTFNEDSEFNAILMTKIPKERIGHISTQMPTYIWCWREDSTTHVPGRNEEGAICHYKRNVNVCEAFRKNLPTNRYNAMVARTVWDAYYAMNADTLSDRMKQTLCEFCEWYKLHKAEYQKASKQDIETIRAISRFECRHTDFRAEIPIDKWLSTIERSAT